MAPNKVFAAMALGKEMDGCGSFMKYALFFSNFIILVGGLVLLSLGIYTVVAKAYFTQLLGTNLYLGATYTIITTGILISLLAFFGCMGAIREIKCMLLMYFIIVFIMFVTLLVGGILGYVFKDKVQYTMRQEMTSSMHYYNQPYKQHITRAWDDTQTYLHCCGVDNWRDWLKIGQVPQSCCKIYPDQRASCQSYQDAGNTNQWGCLNVTTQFVQQHATVIGGAGIGVACIMLLGMIFSCGLFMSIE